MGWPGPMTHRQFLAWQMFLADEWYEPSPTDAYLAALVGRLDNLFAAAGTTWSVGKYLHRRPNRGPAMTLEQATKESQARVWAATGRPEQAR